MENEIQDPHAPGAKLDSGKVRPALMMSGFARALLRVAEVSTYGANKYTEGGWQHVPDAKKRYMDAMMRHLLAHWSNESTDQESGLPHLAHAAWNALCILELQERPRATWPAPMNGEEARI